MITIKHKFKFITNGILLLFVAFLSTSTVYGQNVNNIQGSTTHIATKVQKKKDSTVAKKGSIVPVPVVITDQNLGYGGMLALGYVHKRKNSTRKDTPPTMTGIMGGGTANGTWLAGVGHSESFKNDEYRYLGFLAYMNINLDFYQIGSIDLSDNPVELNFSGWGTLQRFLFRIGNSNFFIGPQYAFFNVDAKVPFEDEDHPIIGDILDKLEKHEIFSAIGLHGEFDSRDNTISPNKGIYAGLELDYNATFLGASENFERLDMYVYVYQPITEWLYATYHFDYETVGGDIPFYLKPYIALRGAPVMRYQGNNAMLLEAQFRGVFYKEWSLVAFGGVGKAFDSFDAWSDTEMVVNYGTGFRYDFKKTFGIRAGADFAWTQDDFGWYISIGTDL